MICSKCGSEVRKSVTTSVTDVDAILIIIRNVPCWKCTECNEISYTADVVKKIEQIISTAKKLAQEISIVDYQKIAA